MLAKRIGFIGAGQMAEALAKGFIAKGVSEGSAMYDHPAAILSIPGAPTPDTQEALPMPLSAHAM